MGIIKIWLGKSITAMKDQLIALLPGKSYFANAKPAREENMREVAKLTPTTITVFRAADPSE